MSGLAYPTPVIGAPPPQAATNHLLASLTNDDLQRLRPQLRTVRRAREMHHIARARQAERGRRRAPGCGGVARHIGPNDVGASGGVRIDIEVGGLRRGGQREHERDREQGPGTHRRSLARYRRGTTATEEDA